MKTMKCENCGGKIDAQTMCCKYCGTSYMEHKNEILIDRDRYIGEDRYKRTNEESAPQNRMEDMVEDDAYYDFEDKSDQDEFDDQGNPDHVYENHPYDENSKTPDYIKLAEKVKTAVTSTFIRSSIRQFIIPFVIVLFINIFTDLFSELVLFEGTNSAIQLGLSMIVFIIMVSIVIRLIVKFTDPSFKKSLPNLERAYELIKLGQVDDAYSIIEAKNVELSSELYIVFLIAINILNYHDRLKALSLYNKLSEKTKACKTVKELVHPEQQN